MQNPIVKKRTLQARALAIRKRGLRSMRGRLIKETMRESHTREFIVRSFVLPRLKKVLGKNLVAVVLYGSSQVGVRKASLRDKESDLDVGVVLKKNFLKLGKDQIKFISKDYFVAEEIEREAMKKFGVPTDIAYTPMEFFLKNFYLDVVANKMPMQILYGQKWVLSNLNLSQNEFNSVITSGRKGLLRKQKYDLRK